MLGRLAKFFSVPDLRLAASERGRVAYFYLLFVLLGAGLAIGRAGADALFFAHVGIDALPRYYLWLAAGLFMTGLAYGVYAGRLASERLFFVLLAVLTAAAGAAGVLLTQGATGTATGFYFVVSAVGAELLLLQAAYYLSQNLDAAQMKRLMLPVLGALSAGGVAGGATVIWAGVHQRVTTLPLIWAGLLAICALLIVVRHRRTGRSPYMPRVAVRHAAWRAIGRQIAHGAGLLNAPPLVRASSGVLFLVSIAAFVLFYATSGVIVAAQPSLPALAVTFGALAAASGLLALLLQMFVTGRLLERLGARGLNHIYPAALLAAFGALLVSVTLPVAIAGSVARDTLLAAIRRPARALTLNVLGPGTDARIRAIQVAVIVPAGLLCAAALTAFDAADRRAMLVAGLVAAGLAVWQQRRANRAYVETLLATLRERRNLPPDHVDSLARGAGPEVIEALVRGVRHADDATSLAYARQLAAVNPAVASAEIMPRLRSLHAPVRDQMLRMLVEARAVTGAQLLQVLAGADEHLRATILGALFDARNDTAREQVAECLASRNPRLVATGIFGVFRYGLREREAEAFAIWGRLLAHRDAHAVLVGLELLTRLPHPVLQARLWALLGHRSTRVRVATLDALAHLPAGVLPDPSPSLERLASAEDADIRRGYVRVLHLLPPEARWPRLFGALGDASAAVRAEAEAAVCAEGRKVVGQLNEWLSQVSVPVRAQRAAARVLARLQPARITALGLVQAKLDYALMLARAREPLVEARQRPDYALLIAVLDERVAAYGEIALELMQCVADTGVIARARAALASGTREDILRAQSALRRVEPRVLGRRFSVLLDGRAGIPIADIDDRNVTRPRGIAATLAWLAEQPDAWLRHCALAASRQSSVAEA